MAWGLDIVCAQVTYVSGEYCICNSRAFRTIAVAAALTVLSFDASGAKAWEVILDRVPAYASPSDNPGAELEIVIPADVPSLKGMPSNLIGFRSLLVEWLGEESRRHYTFVAVVEVPSARRVPRVMIEAASGFLRTGNVLEITFAVRASPTTSSGASYTARVASGKARGLSGGKGTRSKALREPMSDALDAFLRDFRDRILYMNPTTPPVPPERALTPRAEPAVEVPLTGRPTGRRWAVLVGISEYESPSFSRLSYADADAEAFSEELRRLGWPRGQIKLLTNKEATKRNIGIALEGWLTLASTDDLILLFWAGHGYADPANARNVYFACHDTDLSSPPTGFRMDRVRNIIDERNARNVILVADTCHAGKIITRGDGRGAKLVLDVMRKDGKVPKGWIFMVGASTAQESVEHPAWSNGAFTYSILQGLRGEADGNGGLLDGRVTMGELKAYVLETMPDITRRVLGVAKHPFIISDVGDQAIWELSLAD